MEPFCPPPKFFILDNPILQIAASLNFLNYLESLVYLRTAQIYNFICLFRMNDKGLHLSIGVRDWMRDPAITALIDNLEIARKRFKIHAGKLCKDDVLPYVSYDSHYTEIL